VTGAADPGKGYEMGENGRAETAGDMDRGRLRAGGPQLTALLVATAVVSAIAGFLYGYDTGIISGALLQISEEFSIGSGR